MIFSKRIVYAFGLILTLSIAFSAQKKGGEVTVSKSYKPPMIEAPAGLQAILSKSVAEVVSSFASKGFKPEEVAATLIDLRDTTKFQMAEVRGGARIYPASVVKMFYLAALERQIEDGKITISPELTRGVHDMIVDSSNEATQYILDVITDTSSGAELPPKMFEAWQNKRNRVNRYFASMGYTNINVNQKTFCEDAYGIEQQSRKYKGENRNMLTTNAVARLLAEIVTGRIAGAERTAHMMTLLKRDPWGKAADADDQNNGFTGKLFIDRNMRDVKLWSKAGWTSKTRHDAAYVEYAGLKFVLVVFTENHAIERDFIPSVAGKVIDAMKQN